MKVDCPHAERCAGCADLRVPYDAQLRAKEARVRDAFEPYGVALDALAIEPATPIVRYRTRAKLVVSGATVGLYDRQGSHEVVDIPECRVLSEACAEVAAAVRGALADSSVVVSVKNALLAIDVRDTRAPDGAMRAMLTLVLREGRRRQADLDAFVGAIVARAPSIATVATSRRREDAPTVLGSVAETLRGPEALPDVIDEVAGRPIWAPAVPGAFVQAHRGEAARIRAFVRHAIEETCGSLRGARVVDAYGGSGAIGLSLAARGADVLLAESFAPAAERVEAAARAQGLSVRAERGDVADVLDDLGGRGARIDAIVLNPPRRGVSPAVRIACAALRPKLVVYLSCEPTTLARDLAHLRRLGFEAVTVRAFDQIPLSAEVETVAVLRGGPTPPLAILAAGERWLAVDKPAYEVADGDAPSTLARVRTLEGLGDAMCFASADRGVSGAYPFARVAPAGPVRLEAEALVLCRGILRPKGTIRGKAAETATRYKRLEVVGGHSLALVRVEGATSLDAMRRDLARIGHPVLGDARGHGPSNRHLFERHGLDRAFLHVTRVRIDDGFVAESKLAPELDAVLRALRRAKGGTKAPDSRA